MDNLPIAVAAVPATLAAFIGDVETLVARETQPERVARGVQARVPKLLSDPGWLAPEYRQPDPIHYRCHVVAVAPSRRFSVLSLVWLPGQATLIHDHIAWCAVGVLQGLEREQRYNLRQAPDGSRHLVPLEVTELPAGHCSILVPPEENIHQVRNAGDTLAISIHVYGADLSIWGSSINQCFDDLPIRAGDHSGVSVPWRQTRLG